MASLYDAGEHPTSATQVRDLQEREMGCAENTALYVQGHS